MTELDNRKLFYGDTEHTLLVGRSASRLAGCDQHRPKATLELASDEDDQWSLFQLPPGVEFVSNNPDAFWPSLARNRVAWAGQVQPSLLGPTDFLVWCDNASVDELEAFARRNPVTLPLPRD